MLDYVDTSRTRMISGLPVPIFFSHTWFMFCHACAEIYIASKYLQRICASEYSADLKYDI